VVILLVLFGSSLTAFVVAPALTAAVRLLHQSSRRGAGSWARSFLFGPGRGRFWLYYRLSFHGAGVHRTTWLAELVDLGWSGGREALNLTHRDDN